MSGHACMRRGFARAHFLDQTARKPKVRLDTMALMKPVQLKVRSLADATATPVCAQQQQHPAAAAQAVVLHGAHPTIIAPAFLSS